MIHPIHWVEPIQYYLQYYVTEWLPGRDDKEHGWWHEKDYGAKEMVHAALFSDPKGASNPTKQGHPSWLDTSAVRTKEIQSQPYI